ncbi:MAG TPA: hypothetical protein VHX42_00415, partial [Candidatus Babeliales bacterium]|nr:hypothetical protein [Candidatus Babeliales bacterium]
SFYLQLVIKNHRKKILKLHINVYRRINSMRTKNFYDILEERLTKEQIAEIERRAQLEVDILKSIQKVLADTMAQYMKKNKIGFNEVVRRLSTSPSQAAKIQRGQANLTLASFAHFLALMDKEPKDIFKA